MSFRVKGEIPFSAASSLKTCESGQQESSRRSRGSLKRNSFSNPSGIIFSRYSLLVYKRWKRLGCWPSRHRQRLERCVKHL